MKKKKFNLFFIFLFIIIKKITCFIGLWTANSSPHAATGPQPVSTTKNKSFYLFYFIFNNNNNFIVVIHRAPVTGPPSVQWVRNPSSKKKIVYFDTLCFVLYYNSIFVVIYRSTVAGKLEHRPGLGCRILFQDSLAAYCCAISEISYKFFSQAFLCYEEYVLDNMSLCDVHQLFAIGQNLEQDNFDTLRSKCAQHAKCLLKKPHFARTLALCANLYCDCLKKSLQKINSYVATQKVIFFHDGNCSLFHQFVIVIFSFSILFFYNITVMKKMQINDNLHLVLDWSIKFFSSYPSNNITC
ncbi:hypothetical protein RFI_15257 [Reticulomyxa filosa]|uniref:Uncharacterized protein n=1 Tax=Reticulomyxa filosa TaxID=46433 RepID=X6N884_RETFI|nr:hypothetical protein RFI_15257 [Reticulomyxa filosa]|eukprot:ETO21949.1 hypothetical protein RFI_15257 [Reticulomyxa filosa]